MPSTPGRDSPKYKTQRAALRLRRLPCWLCRQPIDYDAPPDAPTAFSLDHVQPVSTHPHLAEVESNQRAAHRRCNLSRGAREPALDLGEPSRPW